MKSNEIKGYVLKLVEYTPKNKEGKPVMTREGKPLVKTLFQVSLPILGKTFSFTVYPNSEIERNLVLDMFRIKKVVELPVKFVTQEIVDTKTGEVNHFTKCQVALDEKDDIHVIELKPLDQDKKTWQMAIKEAASGYKPSDDIVAYRKERYEAATANKKDTKNK